ncbi:uncharacterized protein [Musca autumnalis]|uniref:uncharacterized protein n=1 Tax=Musca autumnalis TaxID=221902 RepID=UPI003CF6A9D5
MDTDHELLVGTIKIKLRRNYKGKSKKIERQLDVKVLNNNIQKRETVSELLETCLPTNNKPWEETVNVLKTIAEEEIGYRQKEARKIWISDNTWKLIQERNTLKEKLLGDANTNQEYKIKAKAVKKAARTDKRKYLENIAIEAEAAAGANDARKVHQVIGRLCNNNLRANRGLKDLNGEIITNPEDQIHLWKQHFERISNIEHDNNHNSYIHLNTNTPINESIAVHIPTVEEIRDAILKLKRNKSPGEDGIPPELLQTNPTASAKILEPYVKCTKASYWCQWETGIL